AAFAASAAFALTGVATFFTAAAFFVTMLVCLAGRRSRLLADQLKIGPIGELECLIDHRFACRPVPTTPPADTAHPQHMGTASSRHNRCLA
ncbi:MAG: hypothetical protein MUC68_06355, partial [Burkholderiaceae bacterium]|nr:hypothetical protein [Burkholderiaceae bacterium]